MKYRVDYYADGPVVEQVEDYEYRPYIDDIEEFQSILELIFALQERVKKLEPKQSKKEGESDRP
jgi:hypothetical protein